jgi:hypothetical protein
MTNYSTLNVEMVDIDHEVSTLHTTKRADSVLSDASDIAVTSTSTSKRFDCDQTTWAQYVAETGVQFLLRPSNGPWGSLLTTKGFDEIPLSAAFQGDLQNDLHPLSSADRFRLEEFTTDAGNSLWCDLQPSLRLASKMMTSAPVMAFLRKVKFGSEVTDVLIERTYIKERHGKSVADASVELLQDLVKLSKKLNLLFVTMDRNGDECDSQYRGIHYVSQTDFGTRVFLHGASLLPPDEGKSHCVTINQAYRDYFTASTERTRTRDMRTCWLLASTLIHEVVGHAFYSRNREDGFENFVEPFFDRDQHNKDPELGDALDLLLFAQRIECIMDPSVGAYIEFYPLLAARKGKHIVVSNSHVVFPVRSAWLHSWFFESNWKYAEQWPMETQMRAFRLPEADYAAVRPNLKYWNFEWKPKKVVQLQGSRVKPVDGYEEKNRMALQKALDDVE